jgi:putative ABC transport system permease protein
MLRNYLLLAVKVLSRNKFYTCVSLFGISVTLMVLVLVTSLVDSFLHPRGPEVNSDRFLLVNRLSISQPNGSGGRRGNFGPPGYRFIEDTVLGLKTPELISVFTGSTRGRLDGTTAVSFVNGTRIESMTRRTDANYWKILQFEFLEGRPISQQEHEQGAYVAVINETTRERFFPGESAAGKRITLDKIAYDVIGVVKNVSPLQALATSDVWLPIFATSSTQFRNEDGGGFLVLMLARSAADFPRIQEEYLVAVRNFIPTPRAIFTPDLPVDVVSTAISKLDAYIRLFRPTVNGIQDPNAGLHLTVQLGAAMLLFMLLPVMNLGNINASRILDRASEIGVRKSFGASSSHLVRQFVVENLVVTALGGLLGFVLAVLALRLLDVSGVLGGEAFAMNYRVFGFGMLYVLVFGLQSVGYPAWKMSRLDPVHALKGVVS